MRVLLVGVDGATFDIINPLIAEGKLPEMKGMMENGSHGVLRSELPMMSPALWTTMLTGKSRDKHKVMDFVNRGSRTLVASTDRDVAAVWNMATHHNVKSGFVGFWATCPAEPVDGWMISDRLTPTRWSVWTNSGTSSQLTYPAELADELADVVVDPRQPDMEEITRLVSLTPEEIEEFRSVEQPIFAHWLSVFKYSYCTQRSCEKIALHMLSKHGQPALMGVFLIANDPISHTFWHFREPDKFPGVDRTKAARLGQLIPNIYEHNDRYLGSLLAAVDKDTVVLIVSDHGFQASGVLPQPRAVEAWQVRRDAATKIGQVAVGQSGMHHLDGVLIASGGPIVKGGRTEAELADITPTILALLGLPIARDMDGRVLEEIIDPAFLQKNPVTYVDSYESLIDRDRTRAGATAGDERVLEQLRSLGYVGEEDEEDD